MVKVADQDPTVQNVQSDLWSTLFDTILYVLFDTTVKYHTWAAFPTWISSTDSVLLSVNPLPHMPVLGSPI